MSALVTRRPTGKVPWPFILLEGEEKAGKSYVAALFTSSEKVGRALWLDLGEGAGDEYGPLGDYEVIEHDGSFNSIHQAVLAAKAEAAAALEAGEPPMVLVIDSMTAVWDLLKSWGHGRAMRRKTNRDRLAADPTAEIVITMDIWNEAPARYRTLMPALLTFPGIVIGTARGKEVAGGLHVLLEAVEGAQRRLERVDRRQRRRQRGHLRDADEQRAAGERAVLPHRRHPTARAPERAPR